jgi:hypothetical protein
LHDAELVAFGIGEDDNNSLGILVALSRISATEFNDPSSRGVHIVNADIQMDADPAGPSAREQVESESAAARRAGASD